ncbi:MAG: metalloregulator ArsR/SmtB family transcription factor [Candidatus Micrarchaeia archaeon]
MNKKELYKLRSQMCKSFSNPARLEILDKLRYKELSVCQIIEKTGLLQANVSQQLSFMKNQKILNSRRDGKNIYYSISDERIIKAFDLLFEFLKSRKY